MKPLHSLLLLPVLLFLSGCVSNLYINKRQFAQEPFTSTIKVCVTNPELTEEFAVLKESGIYQIAETPSPDTYSLTLKPLKGYFLCGTPQGAVLIMTLGLIPVTSSAPRDFSYVLSKDGTTQDFTHRLHLYARASIWEWFFFKKDKEAIARALSHSRRENSSEMKHPWGPP